MERACSRIQSFVLLPLDWELVYVTGLKSEKIKHMYADFEDINWSTLELSDIHYCIGNGNEYMYMYIKCGLGSVHTQCTLQASWPLSSS